MDETTGYRLLQLPTCRLETHYVGPVPSLIISSAADERAKMNGTLRPAAFFLGPTICWWVPRRLKAAA